MNTFRRILGGFLILVIATGCVKYSNELVSLEDENSMLKQQLDMLQNDNKDEQLAIFQYIDFVDSIDKVLNNVFVEFITIQNGETKIELDKKMAILHKLNNIVDELNRNQIKINELEKKFSEGSTQHLPDYKSILENLKKESLSQIREINDFQSKMDSLFIQVEKQNLQIQEQDSQIQEQQEIIANQRSELKQGEKVSKKRYILLVTRRTAKKIEMNENYIVIPKKSRKIKIDRADIDYCTMVDVSNKQTKLIVDDAYWDYNRIMTVRISGRL